MRNMTAASLVALSDNPVQQQYLEKLFNDMAGEFSVEDSYDPANYLAAMIKFIRYFRQEWVEARASVEGPAFTNEIAQEYLNGALNDWLDFKEPEY